ncbi:MAG: DEAD/DEAH box helicase [Paracoccaceae bacterium]
MTTFADLGLSPKLLARAGKDHAEGPRADPGQAIPHIMQGRDLMGLAQTGTGKTAAFGLPLCCTACWAERAPGPRHVRALILAPTRELTLQIKDNLETFTKGTHIKVLMVVGGASINKQARP